MINMLIILFITLISSAPVFGVGVSEYLLNKKVEKQYSDKQYEAAIETLLELTEKYPEKGEYNHNIGQLYLEQNKPQEAEMYFGKALQNLPESKQEDTLSNLAASYLLQQNLNVSKELYKKILKNNPNNQIAKHNLELILNLEKEEQQNQEQNQDQENQDQENQEQENQEQENQEQENQDQENQEQENKNNESESEDEKDNENDGANQEQDKDEELERELEEAKQAQQEEEERRKQMAYDILNQLSQREQEAREKHAKKDIKQQAVDYDW